MNDDSLARFEGIFRIDLDRRFDQIPERVWEALTDSNQVSDWMKFPARIDAHVGGAIFVDFTPDEPLSRSPSFKRSLKGGGSGESWGANGSFETARNPDCLPKPSVTVSAGAIMVLSDGSSVRMENVVADDAAIEFCQPFVRVRCVMRVLTPDRSALSRL